MNDSTTVPAVSGVVAARLSSPSVVQATRKASPNYWVADPSTLYSTANVNGLAFGTGHQIYRDAILPAIEDAETEVILVTCFWARSATLADLNDTLRRLSAKAQRNGMNIRVRLCFSSSSLWQKLLQTSSLKGKTWPESKWHSRLGLPCQDDLQGLDLTVRSIFQLPFSVMHPKFVVIDRRRVLLPSCNVSWEDWFEGCIDLSGPVVQRFVSFWQNFWASGDEGSQSIPKITASPPLVAADLPSSHALLSFSTLTERGVPAMFLPSPHHRLNLPWLSSERPPATPLNIYLLTLFALAEKHIFIQTPNLTSTVVLSEVLAAIKRGVDVTIVTSRRLMRLEQIVTAGITTARCVRRLVKQYERLWQRSSTATAANIESGLMSRKLGRLVIRYYEPRAAESRSEHEPMQSHLKLTLVDGKYAVFGSGNMDRASWHTSQELGLALCSEIVVKQVWDCLSAALEGRSIVAHDSQKP